MASSSTTTKSNNFNQGSQTGTSVGGFSNPALTGFQNALAGNIQKGMAQSNQPLYGQAQQEQYLNNLNSLANSSISSLQSQLARTGALNSGAAASGATQIGLGRMGQQANYLANVPLMNRQAQLQAAQTYGGLGNQLMGVAPRSQQTSGTEQGTSSGLQTQTYNPSILSDIGQGLGIAGGVMGMPMFGGGGATPQFTPPNANNSSAFAPQNTDFSSMPGMGGGQVGQNFMGNQMGGQLPPWLQPSNLMWNGQPQG